MSDALEEMLLQVLISRGIGTNEFGWPIGNAGIELYFGKASVWIKADAFALSSFTALAFSCSAAGNLFKRNLFSI